MHSKELRKITEDEARNANAFVAKQVTISTDEYEIIKANLEEEGKRAEKYRPTFPVNSYTLSGMGDGRAVIKYYSYTDFGGWGGEVRRERNENKGFETTPIDGN